MNKKLIGIFVVAVLLIATVSAFTLILPPIKLWAEDSQSHNKYGFKISGNIDFPIAFSEIPTIKLCQVWANPSEFYTKGGRDDCRTSPKATSKTGFNPLLVWDYSTLKSQRPEGFWVTWIAETGNGEHQSGITYVKIEENTAS